MSSLVLRSMDINVITFSNPLMLGTAMSIARERQKAEFMPAFSLLRLSALARLGGACIVIAGLWAVVLWALA
ncbi:MAG TPA: hypothetical protein VFC11_04415 [Methylocella sp.]|nr:hypothetical protein [Methylocella sp.]